MKKILILLVIICFCGCSTGVTKEEPTQNINIKYYYKSHSVYLYTAEIEGQLKIFVKQWRKNKKWKSGGGSRLEKQQ